jgi:TRAP-type mannitol/chloroaromatic compound transport system substrate-binding protein
MRKVLTEVAVAALSFSVGFDADAQTKSIKVQSSWPASLTIQDHLRILADRIDKLSGGQPVIHETEENRNPLGPVQSIPSKLLGGWL